MYSGKCNTSKQRRISIKSTVIIMAKDGDIVAKALCQLLEKKFIADGMDKDIAKIMSSRACEVGVKATGRGIKRAGKATKKRALNSWQKFVKQERNRYKYKSGKRKGQVNMKAMSAAFKKTPAGRKKK
jgi:hypothetical protein